MLLEERIAERAYIQLKMPADSKDVQSVRAAVEYHVRIARDIFTENTLTAISTEDWVKMIIASIKSRQPAKELPLLILAHALQPLDQPRLRVIK